MARLEVKENVVFAEVKEGVSPYGEMMKLLKEYIDQVDSITYCDELPTEGETDHLYIVRTGEAYIYEGEWIQLTGGSDGITGISVNGTPQEVINHVVDLLIPTKTSELEDDSGYITDEALEGYAKETDIPTKTSQLENDSDYTTTEAVKSEIAEQIAEIVAGAPESLDTLKEIADWIEGHAKDAAEMNTAIKEAQETADNALTESEGAQSTANAALTVATEATGQAQTAQETAESKVSSVNIGTVTTGDSPSVTNSGTAKDVVMDFVFPSGGGGSGVLTGTAEEITFTVSHAALGLFGNGEGSWCLVAFGNEWEYSCLADDDCWGDMYIDVVDNGKFTMEFRNGSDLYYTIIGATLD